MAFHHSPHLAIDLLSVTCTCFSTINSFSFFNTETNAAKKPPFCRKRKLPAPSSLQQGIGAGVSCCAWRRFSVRSTTAQFLLAICPPGGTSLSPTWMNHTGLALEKLGHLVSTSDTSQGLSLHWRLCPSVQVHGLTPDSWCLLQGTLPVARGPHLRRKVPLSPLLQPGCWELLR